MSEEQKEIKELKSRLSLIETFYEENSFIKKIKFYWKYIKEKRRYANYRNDRKNDTNRNNRISNNSISDTWNYEIDKIFNNEEIK